MTFLDRLTYTFAKVNPAAKLAHMRNRLINLAFLFAIPTACATVPPPPPAAPQTAPGPDFLARNSVAEGVVTTPSGLQYFIIKSGPPTGRSPGAADSVVFDYEGKLTTGETFDSSYARGQPLSGGVADFVPGFTEALMLMRPGDEWIVWIPPALGYGDKATGTRFGAA
jgi:peptidylprolyl isomerase/FKBP-type peptidyl-prolyl cis-trans isomerase FklB